MHFTLILLAVWVIWQIIQNRTGKSAKASRWVSIPHEGAARRDFVMPSMEERISSCYRTLEEFQETEGSEAIALLYSRGRMFRAGIFQEGRQYQVCYQSLKLWDEEAMYWDYEPGKPCGYWQYDGGESWFDDLESAVVAAQTVLKQLETAEIQ